MLSLRAAWPLIAVAFLLGGGMLALCQEGPKPKRAKPPAFTPAQSEGIFFPDLFEKGLTGTRPADFGAGGNRPLVGGPSIPGNEGPAASGGKGWAAIISPETLQDEVTALKRTFDTNVTTPTAFAGGGYKEVRREATVLALIFGIIAEYDGEVRFKSSAAAARDLFGRLGTNTKVNSTQAYNEAKARKNDLADIVNGNALTAKAEETPPWNKTVDRPPLMQRLDIAEKQRWGPGTSNGGEFAKQADMLLREAELTAAIAEVIGKEGFEFTDDKAYLGYAAKLKAAARKLADAVKQKNYEAARTAVGEMSKSCTECHESFRA
jgi:hypothetical protein